MLLIPKAFSITYHKAMRKLSKTAESGEARGWHIVVRGVRIFTTRVMNVTSRASVAPTRTIGACTSAIFRHRPLK